MMYRYKSDVLDILVREIDDPGLAAASYSKTALLVEIVRVVKVDLHHALFGYDYYAVGRQLIRERDTLVLQPDPNDLLKEVL